MAGRDLSDEDLRAALVRMGLDPILVRDKLASGHRVELEDAYDVRADAARWPPELEVKAAR